MTLIGSVTGVGMTLYQAIALLALAIDQGRQNIGLIPEYRYSDVVSNSNSSRLLIYEVWRG